jgi:hypothetical protein
LRSGVLVANAATVALASTGRVDNRLGRGSRVCLGHHVDESLARAVPLRYRGLTGAVHMDLRAAALTVLEFRWSGLGETRKEWKHGDGLHDDGLRLRSDDFEVGHERVMTGLLYR